MKKSELKQLIKEEIQKILNPPLNEEMSDFISDIQSALGNNNSPETVIKYLGRRLEKDEYRELIRAGVMTGSSGYPGSKNKYKQRPTYNRRKSSWEPYL